MFRWGSSQQGLIVGSALAGAIFCGLGRECWGVDSVRKTPRAMIPQTPAPGDPATLPKVIRVERNTPVFQYPSAKSKILADVDVGTVLIARELSNQGRWLFVEDEDGNKGWLPRGRTNFQSLLDKRDAVPDSEIDDAKEDAALERNMMEPPRFLWVAGGTAHTRGFGAEFSFLMPYFLSEDGVRERRMGLAVGAYRHWNQRLPNETVSVPLRFRMLARDRSSWFGSGPDVGAIYRWGDKSWGAGLGYSLGLVPRTEIGITSLIRGGFEFGGKTHAVLEWQIGWMF